jgi:hypothetical protein
LDNDRYQVLSCIGCDAGSWFCGFGSYFLFSKKCQEVWTPVLDSFNQAITRPFIDSTGIRRNFYTDFGVSEQFDADCFRYMLIFYGLSLVNAGKFTFGEIHYLGLSQIVLGILAGVFVHHELLFWTIGFGLMYIGYGIVMYYRHER